MKFTGEHREQLELLTALGLGTFMFFTGSVLVLVSVGIVDPDGISGVGRRVVAFVFGGVIVVLAGTTSVTPLVALAKARGAETDAAIAWLAFGTLVRRITLRSVVAAAFLVPLVWSYWNANWGEPSRGLSHDALRDLVGLEFLVVHGFPFFVLAASLARGAGPWPKRVSFGCLGPLLLLYSAFAWSMGRWAGTAGLLYLLLPNILAFARDANDWTVRATAVSRWILKIVALMGIAFLLDAHNMQAPGIVRVGFWYFGLIALIELFRVIDLPVDLGNAWAKLPHEVRHRVKLPRSPT